MAAVFNNMQTYFDKMQALCIEAEPYFNILAQLQRISHTLQHTTTG
jgi:hypothetical protein